ncbi:MAG: type VI secretion system baseplate subunit TssG [Myxococcota bacterium]|nr:type VI secretion system baseplate subunit TssG [Myxococcota bacterium]
MATADRPAPRDLSWLERLARDPGSFDFHVALRRFEASFPSAARLGEAVRPADEPLRVGQTPSSSFQPTAVAGFEPPSNGAPAELLVSFLGLWGPHGPLPSHVTEYARERARHVGDTTLTRLLNIFHHRMLLLFHRAWAQTRPTAALDREDQDRFARYIGSFFGLGLPSSQGRDAFPDRAKLAYASRFASAARNAEGLRDIVADYFDLPTRIEEFVGEWIDVPVEGRWELGISRETGTLSRTAVLGNRVWSRNHKFRIVFGPLSPDEFERTLPNSEMLGVLSALVRLYTNDEWDWDVRLVLGTEATAPMRLGGGSRLGWTTRIGLAPAAGQDLLIDPTSGRTRRVPSRAEDTTTLHERRAKRSWPT